MKRSKVFVVISGNAAAGFYIMGPFESEKQAEEFAEYAEENYQQGNVVYTVHEVQEPEY